MPETKSTFLKQHKKNFETLKRAFANGDVALVECQEMQTGEKVAVLAAVNFSHGEYEIIPFARMISGNPFDQLFPPDPKGGFKKE